MIEYLTCIIKDGMSDREIYETIASSSAYYVLDARQSPDRPLDVIYNEQRNRAFTKGLSTPLPANSRRPDPIKIQ